MTDPQLTATSDLTRTPTEQVPPAPAVASAPDLIGLSLEAACEAAAWAGSTIAVSTTERSHDAPGTVVAQSPSPGTRMGPPRQVRVLVSVRPEPPPAGPRPLRRFRRWGG